MGDWGYGPFDNDCALDWVQGLFHQTMFALLIGKINEFLCQGRNNDVTKSEVEAAVALLLFLCDPPSSQNDASAPPRSVSLFHLAKRNDAFKQALSALECLKKDDTWIRDFPEPEKKLQVLNQLIESITRLRDRP